MEDWRRVDILKFNEIRKFRVGKNGCAAHPKELTSLFRGLVSTFAYFSVRIKRRNAF